MKKFLLISILCLIVTPVFAAEITSTPTKTQSQTAQAAESSLLQRLKANRTAIYQVLNLTPEQKIKINNIDSGLYSEIEPIIAEMTVQIDKLNELVQTKNFTTNDIKAIRKDYDIAAKHAASVKKSYDKELFKLLSAEQKKTYNLERQRQRAKIEKEIELLRNNSANLNQ